MIYKNLETCLIYVPFVNKFQKIVVNIYKNTENISFIRVFLKNNWLLVFLYNKLCVINKSI